MESFSGVMVGNDRRQGLMASSKTEARFVRWRISDLLSLMGTRVWERSMQPEVLLATLLSSMRAKSGGTTRGKCASRCIQSVDC